MKMDSTSGWLQKTVIIFIADEQTSLFLKLDIFSEGLHEASLVGLEL